jgi:CheY-like chemotaxis protein
MAERKAKGPSQVLRVLVADDDADGRDMLTFLLTSEGHVVEAAEDGRQALDKVATFKPDVGIFDLGMPGVNGFEVARRLRARPGADRLFLIALSGLGQSEDKIRAVEAGFDLHFTKPVDFGTLLSSFEQRRARRAGPN